MPVSDIKRRIAAIRAHPLSQSTMNAGNPDMASGLAAVHDISVLAGWLEPLEDCFREIDALPVEEWPRIDQIKEKFSIPCFRYHGGSPAVHVAVRRYLTRCKTRCQVCGADAQQIVIDGWHILLCKTHADLGGRISVSGLEKIWLGEIEIPLPGVS